MDNSVIVIYLDVETEKDISDENFRNNVDVLEEG